MFFLMSTLYHTISSQYFLSSNTKGTEKKTRVTLTARAINGPDHIAKFQKKIKDDE